MERSLRTLSTGAVAGLVMLSSMAVAQGGGGRSRGAPPPASGNADQPMPGQTAQPRQILPPPRSPAEMLLRRRERLQLTDDQAKRLDALAKTQRDALKPQRSNMLRAEADLADAEDKENFDAQRSALEKMAKIRIDQDIAQRRALKDARDLLTPEQRDLMAWPMLGGMGAGGRGMRPGFGGAMMQRGRGGMSGFPGGARPMGSRAGPPGGPPD